MRRSARTAAAALSAACVWVTGTALPVSAAARSRTQELAGSNVMRVARPSVADVVLPDGVRVWHPWLDPDQADFSFTGGNEPATFALVGADTAAAEPIALLGGRLPEEADGAPFLTHFGLGPEGPEWKGFWDLPAGRYRLYLFTEEPVTLTLSLQGLAGRTRIVPSARARFESRSPEVIAGDGPVRNLYSGGATGSLDGVVSQFQVFWTRESVHASSYSGFCWYDGAPPEAAVAYAPGCPAADSQDVVEMSGVWAGESLTIGTGLRMTVPTGESGQGVWFASAAAVGEVGHMTSWLDLGLR